MATAARILRLRNHIRNPFLQHIGSTRAFTALAPSLKELRLPPRVPIPESEITIAYLKGSGPGGQKINKTASAVQIKHLPSGLVFKCQETRSRDQNKKICMRNLQDRLDEMENGEESRVARKREVERRKKASKMKKARRKYRKVTEGKEADEEVLEHREGNQGDSARGNGTETAEGADTGVDGQEGEVAIGLEKVLPMAATSSSMAEEQVRDLPDGHRSSRSQKQAG